ncbi:MAG: preprotein translocase subunit SecE [Rhizobiaceae bacterium]
MAAKTNPFTFLQQVRTEVSKVTWPTRRETVVSSIMVFVMVALAGVFFFVLDQGLSWFVGLLLNLGG